MGKHKMIALILSLCVAVSAAYPVFAGNTEKIIVELENTENAGYFKVGEDATASGGKYVRFDAENGALQKISFTVAEKSNCTITVRHRAKSDKTLGFMVINNLKTALKNNRDGSWTTSEFKWNSVLKGENSIYYYSRLKGQEIDSVTVSAVPTGFTNNVTYVPGDDKRGELQIATAKEVKPGSFMFEMENSTLYEKFQVYSDEDASGGKYVSADISVQLTTSADDDSKIYGRYKFNVTEKGNYVIWSRYKTPKEYCKSSWVGIDEDYYRYDTWSAEGSVTPNWTWMKVGTTRYLDEGWHTFDVKPRQGGHMLDCFILTLDESFTPEGKGSMPGEPIIPDKATEIKEQSIKNSPIDLYVNNFLYKTDVDTVLLDDGDAYLAATTFINALGMQLETYDGYYVARQGRKYIRFTPGSNQAVVNGKKYKMKNIPYMHDGVIPMISMNAVLDTFGGSWDYIDIMHSIYVVFDDIDEGIREAKEGEIAVEPYVYGASFSIPHDNPNAKVEAWVKIYYDAETTRDMQNFKTASAQYAISSSWRNGYKQQRDSGGIFYWKKAYTPYYKDGAFHGCFTGLTWRACDIKVKIIENGVADTFIKRNAFKPQTFAGQESIEQVVPKTDGKLLLKATYENLSYYIDCDGEQYDCSIFYREKGTEEWKPAYAPMYDGYTKQYRGSIVMVKENTEYEVKADIKTKIGGIYKTETATIKTKADNPPIGKELKLSDLRRENGSVVIIDMEGSENAWIRIDCEGQEINAGLNNTEAVLIYNSRYIIFENAKITGGDRYCIHITGHSDNIRISNCDISEWGRTGWLDLRLGNYLYDGNPRNLEGGIMVSQVKDVTIERCYIHDPNTKTNTWKGPTWNNLHPCGADAITMAAVSGLVVRYNDMIGSDGHRWNDAMESYANGSRILHGTGDDSDIYGNMFYCAEDDFIELDGGQMNVRFYNNRGEQSLCGVSVAPNMSGPSYIFRNQITNLGTSDNDMTGTVIKAGGSPDGVNGVTYLFHNTFDTPQHIVRNVNYSGAEYHSVSRNNIFMSRNNSTAITNTTLDHRDDNDYDLTIGSVKVNDGDEKNAVTEKPIYTNMETGDYTLKAESPGVNAGVPLANFSDGFTGSAPDMGAFEIGGMKTLPYRPIDIYADKTHIELSSGEVQKIKLTVGNIEEGMGYSILKNKDYTWLEVVEGDTKGTLTPNSTIEFSIRADLSKSIYTEGNGLVLIRLDNGYSVPVTVYCE